MAVKTKTGQIIESDINNCPVFIPNKLSETILSQLRLSVDEVNNVDLFDGKFNSIFQLYFYKFFAGDKSLTSGFADIAIVDLYLWQRAKVATSVYVKEVVNSTQRFTKVVDDLSAHTEHTRTLLVQKNKALRPKNKIHGIRTGKIRAGHPKNNPYAFFCVPVEYIDKLFADLIEFINLDSESAINNALTSMMQFIYIHPFKDGNGRISRALFVAKMKCQFGLNFSCMFMLYLKNINRMGYYATMQEYRNGNIREIKKLHIKALEWTNQSAKTLSDFIQEYTNKVGQHNIDSDSNYSQVVIKTEVNQKLDESVFHFHSKKTGKNIYINTALLNVLNQFDYYLRYELRKHQTS